MERAQATVDSFVGVPVELPGGRVVRCKALTVSEAVTFLGLLDKAERADDDGERAGAQLEFIDTFSQRVGVEGEELTPFEVFELARRFLRLPTWSPLGRETETKRAQSSTLGSTT